MSGGKKILKFHENDKVQKKIKKHFVTIFNIQSECQRIVLNYHITECLHE